MAALNPSPSLCSIMFLFSRSASPSLSWVWAVESGGLPLSLSLFLSLSPLSTSKRQNRVECVRVRRVAECCEIISHNSNILFVHHIPHPHPHTHTLSVSLSIPSHPSSSSLVIIRPKESYPPAFASHSDCFLFAHPRTSFLHNTLLDFFIQQHDQQGKTS